MREREAGLSGGGWIVHGMTEDKVAIGGRCSQGQMEINYQKHRPHKQWEKIDREIRRFQLVYVGFY